MRYTKEEIIKERIFDLFPISHLGYTNLLSLLSITLSKNVPTASVTLGSHSVMELNPDFIEKMCFTDERLSMLILHEIMHILLGHTRMYPRAILIQNLAFDAVINAHICTLFPDPEYTALFRDLYSDSSLPEALLRPPAQWHSGSPEWKLSGEAKEIHQALYSNQEITYSEILHFLKTLPLKGKLGNSPILIGTHQDKKGSIEIEPALFKEIENIVTRWPRAVITHGRDSGSTLTKETISLEKAKKCVVNTIRKAIIATADKVTQHISSARILSAQQTMATLPWRTVHDRKGVIIERLSSHQKLLWNEQLETKGLERFEPPTLYIDVSGSMNQIIPMLYGAILPLRSFIHSTIYLFSTTVNPISFSQLRRGLVTSTFGTEIECVTEDMIRRDVKQALIISDGYWGDMPLHHQEKVKNIKISVVLTKDHITEYMKHIHGKRYYLPL